MELHLDPAVNYLIRKAVYSVNDGTFHRWDEVEEFKECSPGLFFPVRTPGGSDTAGTPWGRYSAEISEVRINDPLPAGIFNLEYPNGVTVTDTIRGSTYQSDGQGTPISREKPLSRQAAPPSPAPAQGQRESTEEPVSALEWLLPISVAILLIGSALVFLRKRSLRAN